jgi:rRNA-processing protein FCF1
MVEKDMNLEEKLKPLIPGKIMLKVTGCTISELEILGRDFYVVLEKAK